MKTKVNITLAFILAMLMRTCLYAQSFYEIKWDVDNTKYKAFLVYYSNEDAYIRVGFKDSKNVYNVAEYEVEGRYYTTKEGNRNYYLDGKNAYIVYGNEDKEYNADNFIFTNINSSREYTSILTYDDSEETDNITYGNVEFKKLDPKNFTENYIYNFFEKTEEEYQELLAIKDLDSKHNGSISNTKLNLIIVANTTDRRIGRGCTIDKDKLSHEFENIARVLNIPINKQIIYDNNFNKSNVINAINDLQVNPNDIVVFFYRGHGFRWKDQKSDWPQMDMRTSSLENIDTNSSISIAYVYNKIVEKGARLNLVFGDLCNTDIGISASIDQPVGYFQSNTYPSLKNLNRLFLEAKGNIISASAKPGQVSWVNSNEGGFYTSSFFEAFDKEVSIQDGNGDWNSLLTTTFTNALKKTYSCVRNMCSPQNGIQHSSITYK